MAWRAAPAFLVGRGREISNGVLKIAPVHPDRVARIGIRIKLTTPADVGYLVIHHIRRYLATCVAVGVRIIGVVDVAMRE